MRSRAVFILAGLFMALAWACTPPPSPVASGSASPTPAPSTPHPSPPLTGRTLAFTAVRFEAASVVAEFANLSNRNIDLLGENYWICGGGFTYGRPSKVARLIPAGATFSVDVTPASSCVESDSRFCMGANTRVAASAGNLALYKSSTFTVPNDMVDFVQWGRAGQGRETEADEADLWTAGTFVDVSGSPPAITARTPGEHKVENWQGGAGAGSATPTPSPTPTPGPSGSGEPTAAPTPRVTLQKALAFVKIDFRGGSDIVADVKNLTDAPINLNAEGWQLCGRFQYGLLSGSARTVAAGATVQLHVNNPAGCSETDASFCVQTSTGVTSSLGDLALYRNPSGFEDFSALQDFVQWGGPNQGRYLVAEDAIIWNGAEFVDVSGNPEAINVQIPGASFANNWQ